MKKIVPLFVFALIFNFGALSQNDSTQTKQENKSEKKTKKRVSDFKVYGGVSTSTMLLSESEYESAYATGFLLGFAYRKGRFGYWEIGLNYNNSVVALEGINILSDNMNIRQLEVPVLGGINLLSATRRVVGLRLFGGAVPGYVVSIGNNSLNLNEDNFNRFQVAGRVGVGVDVLFLFVEVGYQYGFMDLLNNQDSNLSQADFRLGFRF